MKALVLFLALTVPAQAQETLRSYNTEARAAITAAMHAVSAADEAARMRQRAHRFLWNAVNAAQNIAQTVIDCNITRKNLVAGGVENDPLVPRKVLEEITTRAHVGRCHAAGWGLSLAGLAVDHYWSPLISGGWTLGEWLNISATR